MSSPNGYDSGWQDCEEEYLSPLQSKIQEVLETCPDQVTAAVWYSLKEALDASDPTGQWRINAKPKQAV
jgi:hypothetical protein